MKGSVAAAEEEMRKLRSRATELLLTEEWNEYINLYSRFISNCRFPQICFNDDNDNDPDGPAKLRRALCCALSKRAAVRCRLRDYSAALIDCELALQLDPAHQKTLICKGNILLDLHCYSHASDYLSRAMALQANDNNAYLSNLLARAQKLEAQSRTGAIDLSDWILDGFDGKCPELAEFIGPVEIRPSAAGGGRGLFTTKSIEAGMPLVITEAVVIGRGILPEASADGGRVYGDVSGRMVLWKDVVGKIFDAAKKCSRTRFLLYTLATGDNESGIEIPQVEIFRSDSAINWESKEEKLDVGRILKVLDLNCLAEESVSAKVMGKKKALTCGVGLWFLPSFVNHSCCPNARRLHVGGRLVLHASRDIDAGEEITVAYYDVLRPLSERRESSKRWGFLCSCERCRFEEAREMELVDFLEIEDMVRRCGLKGKEKGFLRASFWSTYSYVYDSERLKKWGGRIPAEISMAESIFDAVGGDERVMKIVLRRLMKNGRGFGHGVLPVEMEKVTRLARMVYGKVMKRQAMKTFFELELAETC
ncbi:Histone-lysine N-methyltransferase ATXR2 [Apostasia shenzhenica]|uniref:Histone-lysine N-methyltransferase ATXR2 n=1 Tax=Apostasia shenzhenica TaxID=1088818 RepID=A0A2I0A2L4_9ASPA|nr:Histone-lysine N-methyltransferase ATXR2 [Apostasia shenzhenica]